MQVSRAAGGAARLELRAISKRFPGTLANDHVSLDVRPGEIHALLGENGAGKSTLVKIIYGVLAPDGGEILWQGEVVDIPNPAAARALGIGMVFQHFSLFESLSVAENILLGIETGESLAALSTRIVEVSRRYGLPLDPKRLVHSLTVGERQRVEILRCLLQEPKLLIMDEPTSVLTPQAAETLFQTLERLAGEGVSILYISHKLHEIRRLCHRATVLRAGKQVAVCDPRAESDRSLAEMMIGADLPECTRADGDADGAIVLDVEELSLSDDDPFAPDLENVSFSLRAGEILGIAGVAGNGQKQLLAALSGERAAPRAEDIHILGRPAGTLGPAARRDLGVAFVPEERLGRGAVPELSLADNALLSAYRREGLVHRGWIRFAKARALAEKIVAAFDVKATGHAAEARSLSGGNLQKFIVGREILQRPKLLIVAQPTWGVDVGAAAAIHQALMDLKTSGTAILVVSEDLDELFAICDRIAVIATGRLSPVTPVTETSIEAIGRAMGGAGHREAHHAA